MNALTLIAVTTHLACTGTWSAPKVGVQDGETTATVSVDLAASQVWGPLGGPYRIEQSNETDISFSGRLDAALFKEPGTVYGVIDRLRGKVKAIALADGGRGIPVWSFDLSCSPAKPKF